MWICFAICIKIHINSTVHMAEIVYNREVPKTSSFSEMKSERCCRNELKISIKYAVTFIDNCECSLRMISWCNVTL